MIKKGDWRLLNDLESEAGCYRFVVSKEKIK